jgi:hypothetical protein
LITHYPLPITSPHRKISYPVLTLDYLNSAQECHHVRPIPDILVSSGSGGNGLVDGLPSLILGNQAKENQSTEVQTLPPKQGIAPHHAIGVDSTTQNL